MTECVQDDVRGCDLTECQQGFECVEDRTGAAQCEQDEQATLVCGANTCVAGEMCCNPSCGICAPPGGTCTQEICDVTAPTCDLICVAGQHCALVEEQCATPPCSAAPACVADEACMGPIIDCAAPPDGCNYVGSGCVNEQWTCGELVCAPPDACELMCDPGKHCELVEEQCSVAPCPRAPQCIGDDECTLPVIDCAVPPVDCNYVGGGCVNGEWTCGQLVCAPVLECDPACEEGQHCESVEVQCYIMPCLPILKCVPN